MKIIPNPSKTINGNPVLVIDPQTGKTVEVGEVIDLDTIDLEKQLHYLRALQEGDFVEYAETKKSKGVE